MSEGIKDASWRTVCGVFAGQAKGRFSWDRTSQVWRQLAKGDTHWQECSFDDAVMPIWLTTFATEFVNALLRRPNDPASQKLLDMTSGTRWTAPDTITLLKQYCKAVWGRDFPTQPRHLLNLPWSVMDAVTDEFKPRADDHAWTWVLDSPKQHEYRPAWQEFLDVILPDTHDDLQALIGAAMSGAVTGTCCWLSGPDTMGKQLLLQALNMSLPNLVHTHTSGRFSLDSDDVRMVLLPHGGDRLEWDAMSHQGRCLVLLADRTMPLYVHGTLTTISFHGDPDMTSKPAFQGHFRRNLSQVHFRQDVANWVLAGTQDVMKYGKALSGGHVPAGTQGSLLD